jgi:hypothetical protein
LVVCAISAKLLIPWKRPSEPKKGQTTIPVSSRGHFSTSSLDAESVIRHRETLERFETQVIKPLLLNLAGSQLDGEAKFRPIVPVVIVV